MRMTKKTSYYFIMMVVGVLVWLEGSYKFLSRWFMDVIILFPPLPAYVHYMIQSLFELAVTYGEVILLLFILSDWRSKRSSEWAGYKKALHLYLIIGIILENIIIYIFQNLFSVYIESYLAAIIMTMVIKIVTIFFMVIIVMRTSMKNKKQALYIDQTSLKYFVAGAIITIGLAGLCSFKEWQDYQIFMSDMNAYGFFRKMTASTPGYLVFNKWMVPYMVRICAVLLFMVDGKLET